MVPEEMLPARKASYWNKGFAIALKMQVSKVDLDARSDGYFLYVNSYAT